MMKLLVVAAVASTTTLAYEPPSVPDWRKVAQQSLPAIVRIEATGEKANPRQADPLFERFLAKTRPVSAAGSGFLLEPNGYVLTSGSVSEYVDSFVVTLQDGSRYAARKVGRDELLDITLLKIDNVSGLPTLKFASSSTLRMGDPVATIGHAFEMDAALTTGIVSAVQQRASSMSWLPYLQTSVLIERGHAGSPLLNEQGNVVGTFSAIVSVGGQISGISLAIPGDLIQQALPELKANGVVQRPQIGIQGKSEWRPIDAPVHQQHLALVVETVETNSPAAMAGVQPGDIITAFADTAIKDFGDLAMRISLSKAGTCYPLGILRDGKPMTLSISPTIAPAVAEKEP